MFYKFLIRLGYIKYLIILCCSAYINTAYPSSSDQLLDKILEINPSVPLVNPVHYSPENLIGRGNFGRVYRGEMGINTQVALKEINIGQALDNLHNQTYHRNYMRREDVEAAVCFEVDFLTRASSYSANIVQFYGIYREETTSNLFLVMKYYASTLKEKIRELRQSREPGQQPTEQIQIQILCYAIDIVHGLNKLHERGVLHRDLKLDNFFIDEDDHVVIGDFGVSKLESSWSKFIEEGVQSRRYKSPEAVLDWQKNPEKTDDIYAFGLILWQLAEQQEEFEEYSWQWIKERMDENVGQFPQAMRETYTQIKSYEGEAISPLEEINKNPDWKRTFLRLLGSLPPRKTTTHLFSALVQQCLSNDPLLRPSASEIEDTLLSLLPHTGEEINERAERDGQRRSQWRHQFPDYVPAEGDMQERGKVCIARNLRFLKLNEHQFNVSLQYLDISSFSSEETDDFLVWLPQRRMAQFIHYITCTESQKTNVEHIFNRDNESFISYKGIRVL